MTAIGLLKGDLVAEDYEDDVANDPRVDSLRNKMFVEENTNYSKDYLDPEKRSIANELQIIFKDGSSTEKAEVEYPIGHRRRREEGIPVLIKKFEENLKTQFSTERVEKIMKICEDQIDLESLGVIDFMEILIKE